MGSTASQGSPLTSRSSGESDRVDRLCGPGSHGKSMGRAGGGGKGKWEKEAQMLGAIPGRGS